MNLEIWQVDAFAERAFGGNPAAIVPLERAAPAEWMQALAAEMNLSETAFVMRDGEAFRLRWFTPGAEVALCGHATLATAHVLWESGRLAEGEAARFDTLSDRLVCRRAPDGSIEMDFPARRSVPCAPPEGLARALGAEPLAVLRNVDDYLVELDSAARVRALAPDFGALSRVEARGVVVTAAADEREGSGVDFVSRFFGPRVGVDEDPVTGSAHCALAPYWAARAGKRELVGHQLSSRGGFVRVRLEGERVVLIGRAVTIFRGELAPAALPPD